MKNKIRRSLSLVTLALLCELSAYGQLPNSTPTRPRRYADGAAADEEMK
jgi:hypothetical protein